jgi:raffinose/stachyose/melibiose transport system substrate-binding protein
VDKFNTANSGLIKINVDGVAGEANVEKLRTDAAGNTMPDLYMLFADAARFQLIADSGRGVDLMPYMRANPELWARVDKDSAAVYTDSKGQLLGLPFVKAYIGIYYNKAIFDAAGVTQFPTTWDGFFDACEKIKASRVAPIAFMTGENSWTTMLMLSHIIGTSDGGVQWLKSTPETVKFTDPVFVQAVEKLQRMMRNYATPDSIGATYAVAASAFNNGMAAMICNGPWMCADFYNTDVAMDGLSRNVVYALAPGGGAIQNENMAYASGSRTKESADAAFEVLKYLASPAVYAEYLNVTSGAPALAIDESLLNIDPIIKKFQSQAVDAPRRYGQFSNCVKQACIDGLGQLLPDLASGTMTPRQFAEQMQRISDSNR